MDLNDPGPRGHEAMRPLTFPCQGLGPHDFAVGPYSAICNRCTEVVVLTATRGPTIEIGSLSEVEADRRLRLCPDCLQFDDHDAGCENEGAQPSSRPYMDCRQCTPATGHLDEEGCILQGGG